MGNRIQKSGVRIQNARSGVTLRNLTPSSGSFIPSLANSQSSQHLQTRSAIAVLNSDS